VTEANVEPLDAIERPLIDGEDCAACAQPPLPRVARCPECGALWIMGVKLTRPVTRLGIGLALGGMAFGSLIALLISVTLLGPTLAAGAASAPPASTAPVASPASVPPIAVAALSGTAVVDRRMMADGASLAATLRRNRPRPGDIAVDLRAIAADAAQGIDFVSRAATWPEARSTTASLEDFYRSVADKARAALQLSLNDQRAYRKAGRAMVRTLKGLRAIDAQMRTLAATAGIGLPSATDSGG
jgi:hypothetical protein